MGLFLAMSLKSQSAPAVVNLLYLPMSFFSGLWIPITIFPSLLQNVAQLLPPYHLAQLALKVVAMDQGQSVLWHVAVLAGYTLVFGWFALKAYYRINAE